MCSHFHRTSSATYRLLSQYFQKPSLYIRSRAYSESTLLKNGNSLLAKELSVSSQRRVSSIGIQDTSRAPIGALPASETWDLYASVCLERKPLITQEMNPLEKKYAQFLAEYEFESSKKSDHELRHENDRCVIINQQ